MRKRATVFIIVLMCLILLYLYTMQSIVFFNHSGNVISKMTIETSLKTIEINDIDKDEKCRWLVYTLLDKNVRVKVETPTQIQSLRFSLKPFDLLQQFNQIEFREDGTMKYGALGLKN